MITPVYKYPAVLLVLCIACISLPRTACSADADKLHTAVVLLRAYRLRTQQNEKPPNSFGTGFVIEGPTIPKGTIVTSYHVVRGASKVRAKFAADDRQTYMSCYCGLVYTDEMHDLAILRSLAPPEPHISGVGFTDIEANDPPANTAVVAIGHPTGLEWTPLRGEFSRSRTVQEALDSMAEEDRPKLPAMALKERVYQLDISVDEGMSGAPVFLTKGAVNPLLGVIWAATKPGGDRRFCFCIPSLYLSTLADQIKRPDGPFSDMPAPKESVKGTELAADARQAVSVNINGQAVPAPTQRFGPVHPQQLIQFFDDPHILRHFNQPTLNQVATSGLFDELVNIVGGFSILVPQGSGVGENYDPQHDLLRLDIITPDNRELHIVSHQRHPKPNVRATDALMHNLVGFRRQVLNVEIVGSSDANDMYHSENKYVFGGLLNREMIQLGADRWRTWRHYLSHPDKKKSIIYVAGNNEHHFIAVYFSFDTGEWRPQTSTAFARQLFSALSISFL